MIELHQFPSDWVLPNASPFCLKLETWLRLAELPYEEKAWSPGKAPLGKAPVIIDNGKTIADSSCAIEHLIAAHGVQLDAQLTKEQRAVATLIQRTLEEHFYWAMLYWRWLEDENWAHYKHVIGASLPAAIRPVLLPMLRRNVRKAAKGHGLSRHPQSEVYGRACADLDAIAHTLGDKPFLLGDAPASVDATGFAFLAETIVPDREHPIRTHALSHRNLVDYVERIRQRVWSDEIAPIAR